MASGRVFLIGAGPGDPELLTLKAARLIAEADVVVYDRLVSAEILALVPDGAARINVGKQAGYHAVPQAEINRLLVRLARSARTVVRLKGGDPFIFGRGSEEAAELARAGVDYRIVPGITAAQGCAAAARVPLTHRGLATGVRFATGHCKADEPLDLDWAGLADPQTTLVLYMGLANIDEIAARLIAEGLPPSTPVLAICDGTTPRERRLRIRLRDVAGAVQAASFEGPVLFVIGRVAAMAAEQDAYEHENLADVVAVA